MFFLIKFGASLKLLNDVGSSLNYFSIFQAGHSALMEACIVGSSKIVSLLLEENFEEIHDPVPKCLDLSLNLLREEILSLY